MANELKFNNKVVFANGSAITLPSLASDPGSAVEGDMYFNTTSHAVKIYSSGAWAPISTSSGITALTGDVTASGSGSVAATVASVGGSSASNVNLAEVAANAATAANTNGAIVKRDISGDFSAGTITASLTGHASLDLPLAGGTMGGPIDMGSNLINNVTDPASAQDAATKNYVDTAVGAIPSGANTTLSNLGTTAVNASIIPATSGAIDLGSTTKAWTHVYAANFQGLPAVSAGAGQTVNLIGTSADSAGSQPAGDINITAGDAFHFATSAGNINVTAGSSHGNIPNGGVVTIMGGDSNTGSIGGKVVLRGGANTVSSTPGTVEIYGGASPNDGGGGSVTVQGGANTGSVGGGNVSINGGPTTTGPGGSVTIQGGTGTTHGSFNLQTFSSTNFHGLVLSNLADPAIAQDAATKNYVDTAVAGAGGANTTLSNLSATSINVDMNPDSDGAHNIGAASLAWFQLYANQAVDDSGVESVGFFDRILTSTGGSTLLSWAANPNQIDITAALNMNGSNISGVADPVSAQDAMTLNYADANYINLSQKGANSGVATLDSGGHIPLSQLPSSLVEYKGTWAASTNTPTLSNTGPLPVGAQSGWFYIASDSGSVNFGAGSISFNAGDWVLFNGTIWERAVQSNVVQSVNGSTGVVTVNAINQLTGDVTAGPASGSASAASTVAKIQGTTVSGVTGTGNVVFSASPTLTGTVNVAALVASGNITGSAHLSTGALLLNANAGASALNIEALNVGRSVDGTNFVREAYYHSTSLVDNSGPTSVAAFSFTTAATSGEEITYIIETGDSAVNTRLGTIRVICSSGVTPTVSISDMFSESADCGITWTAAVSAGTVTVSYTASNQGANRTMRADVKTFAR